MYTLAHYSATFICNHVIIMHIIKFLKELYISVRVTSVKWSLNTAVENVGEIIAIKLFYYITKLPA